MEKQVEQQCVMFSGVAIPIDTLHIAIFQCDVFYFHGHVELAVADHTIGFIVVVVTLLSKVNGKKRSGMSKKTHLPHSHRSYATTIKKGNCSEPKTNRPIVQSNRFPFFSDNGSG